MVEWGREVVWPNGGVRWCGRVGVLGGVVERGSEVVWPNGGVRWCGRVGE